MLVFLVQLQLSTGLLDTFTTTASASAKPLLSDVDLGCVDEATVEGGVLILDAPNQTPVGNKKLRQNRERPFLCAVMPGESPLFVVFLDVEHNLLL